jgi:hypothetical protein
MADPALNYAYIGKKPDCGCVVAIVCDFPLVSRKDVGRCVAEFIKNGYEVTRIPLDEGSTLVGPCKHVAAQPALL